MFTVMSSLVFMQIYVKLKQAQISACVCVSVRCGLGLPIHPFDLVKTISSASAERTVKGHGNGLAATGAGRCMGGAGQGRSWARKPCQ